MVSIEATCHTPILCYKLIIGTELPYIYLYVRNLCI